MIKVDNRIFKLDTADTSYIFSVTDKGHLEHIYYGPLLKDGNYEALRQKNTILLGSTVNYEDDDAYSLDHLLLEYSGTGKGDFRESPAELIMPDGSFVFDFCFDSHTVTDGAYQAEGLPTAYGDAETLTVLMKDKKYPNIELRLYYTVFEAENVIARAVELENRGEGDVYIRKLMSYMLDFPYDNYDMITLNGSWIKEAHICRRRVDRGTLVNSSATGSSSNKHNPAFMLVSRDADDERGRVYGFNLIYSGNHYSAVEQSDFGSVRVMGGINPHCFLWRLKKGEKSSAPQAVMTFSDEGINGMSENMHAFVNERIVRGKHKSAERPIVINNWEATFFNFNSRKILALARRAKRLGIEMIVLDDGWFGNRNSDRAGLGDWVVNKRKLPGGINALARRVNKMGMRFGLWFEPECVNPDSELYRAHPDWAITVEGREPSLGRHQLVLDLTRAEVRDYIVDSLHRVLSEANIEYVKWDYNRHISDMFSRTLKNQGEFYHRYILGLYDILNRVFIRLHPNILLESCSSGGNRFDLGMLCYSPQIWTSDNTDPIERLDIQRGIYTFYPQSAVSAHVSMSPHQQTLRATPLSTRFNVATFGVLGYELDFAELTPSELKEVKSQIEFYKSNRCLLQYGALRRVPMADEDMECWQISGEGKIIAGVFNRLKHAAPCRDILRVPDADAEREYTVATVGQRLRIKRFGSLIKHITPIALRIDGFVLRTVDRHFSLKDGEEIYRCRGDVLNYGISLAMQYEGTGYNPDIRVLGDFGSNLYLIKENENG